jgi:hypothetical protein
MSRIKNTNLTLKSRLPFSQRQSQDDRVSVLANECKGFIVYGQQVASRQEQSEGIFDS